MICSWYRKQMYSDYSELSIICAQTGTYPIEFWRMQTVLIAAASFVYFPLQENQKKTCSLHLDMYLQKTMIITDYYVRVVCMLILLWKDNFDELTFFNIIISLKPIEIFQILFSRYNVPNLMTLGLTTDQMLVHSEFLYCTLSRFEKISWSRWCIQKKISYY